MPLKNRTEKSDSESLKFRHATLLESLDFRLGGKGVASQAVRTEV